MMDLRRLDWILSKAQDMDELSDWDTEFIDDMTDRREALGDGMSVTPAQETQLERIAGLE